MVESWGPIYSTELLYTVTGCLKEKLTSSHLTGGCFEVAAEETAPERSKASRSDNIRQTLQVTVSGQKMNKHWVKQMWSIFPVSQWTESSVEPHDKGRGHGSM